MGTSGIISTSNKYVKYTITIVQNWQDISNNYSNVTISVRFFRTNTGYETYGNGACYCNIDGGFHSAGVSRDQKITNAGIVLFSENHNINHNADGSKYLDTSAWIDLPDVLTSNEEGYGEWLSHIPRNAVCTDATNFNDEQNPTIYFNNPGNFELYLKMEAGGDDYLIKRDKVTRSSPYNFVLSETERNLLRSKTPNSNSLSVRFTVGTYMNGSITNWTYVDRRMNIINGNPTFNDVNVSYKDTNTTVVSITENNQHIVRNQSNLSVNFTSAISKKYSTISKYQLTLNGATIEKTLASTVNFGLVDSGNDLTLTIKAIDSRGNIASVSKIIKMFDWQLPTAVITANRENNYEDKTYLKVDATISSVNSKNNVQDIKYRYKKTSTSVYSSYTSIENYKQNTIIINKLYAWDFQVVIIDRFGSTTYNFVIAKGIPIMFFDTQKLSVGINKFPEYSASLETDEIYLKGKKILDLIYPIGSIYMSVNNLNPSILFGGIWSSWCVGRVPVGVNPNDSDFNAPDKSGGNRTHAHTLYSGAAMIGSDLGQTNTLAFSARNVGDLGSTSYTLTTDNKSPSSYRSHNTALTGRTDDSGTLQPYLTCYMWKRTA